MELSGKLAAETDNSIRTEVVIRSWKIIGNAGKHLS